MIGALRLALGGRLCLLALAILAAKPAPAAIWNAAADYDAGWTAGTNPNGAWSYGWSASLASPLNLYTRHHINPIFPDFRIWDDPAHQASLTPNVYKNVGPFYPLGSNTIEVPPGALILHGGGPTGDDFSHVVWTAPSTGSFSLNATFTGRQGTAGRYQTFVYVLKNGTTLFQDFLNFLGDGASYNTSLSLSLGDKIDFAVGITGTGLHGETTQLEATISNTTVVPEPTSCLAVLTGFGFLIVVVSRHRHASRPANTRFCPS